MGKTSDELDSKELELIDEWPIALEGCIEGLMVEAGAGKALAALKLPNDYEDGCFVFDIGNRSSHSEKWFQPDWVNQRWKVMHSGPEKGILDLSVATKGTKSVAAVATRAGYVACWELGSEVGCMIESEYGVRAVAVHPNTGLLTVGTGRKVLDTVSKAIAEVQLWCTDSKEMLHKQRLPGSCVINMLWVHHEDGLLDSYVLDLVDGRPIGKDRACVVMESGALEVVLAVTTETRNQRGGFITLLDPQLLTILDMAEIPEASGLGVISAWPERREIWAGGFRSLENLYETYNPKLNLWTAPQKTAAKITKGLWLSDGRMLKFSRDRSDAWVAQVWGTLSCGDISVTKKLDQIQAAGQGPH
ncbi:MAG: Uncharacterised protein [Prochlorococcus marinus str. MIT 9215]|nr:MAG: Uncharacterised protein [Prochlorococcus marinus str. MIT 9215]